MKKVRRSTEKNDIIKKDSGKKRRDGSALGSIISILFFAAVIGGILLALYLNSRGMTLMSFINGKNGEAVSVAAETVDPEENNSGQAGLIDSDAGENRGASEIMFDDLTVVARASSFDPMSGVSVPDEAGDIADVTITNGSVDTSKTGTYFLTYEMTDKNGYDSKAVRMVSVADQVYSYDGKDFGVFWNVAGVKDQPYLVAVNCFENVVTVYEKDKSGNYTVPVKAFICSVASGTPEGYYQTLERMRWQELYDDSWGQYAIRIVNHILFHSVPYHEMDPSTLEYEEYNKLGVMASQGCVRLQVENIKWLFDNCPNGFPTVIYRDDASPGPLGKPEYDPIDVTDTVRRGWDPTDPDPANPWKKG